MHFYLTMVTSNRWSALISWTGHHGNPLTTTQKSHLISSFIFTQTPMISEVLQPQLSPAVWIISTDFFLSVSWAAMTTVPMMLRGGGRPQLEDTNQHFDLSSPKPFQNRFVVFRTALESTLCWKLVPDQLLVLYLVQIWGPGGGGGYSK